MIKYLWLLILLVACDGPKNENMKTSKPPYALVIHGGAGTISRSNMDTETENKYLASLNLALDEGEKILKEGGTSLEAVEATIKILEDNPLFNAGKGAVFNHEGRNELDASIMTGHDQKAGAVGGVTRVKNPITLARTVMEKSEHVMMVGAGAEEFGALHNIETVDPSYFFTESRWNGLQRIKSSDNEETELSESEASNSKKGTVGCVALDQYGNLAAGTSTGGMTNKKFNRIGDSPIIGAGTFADNNTCAVSCTGHGEFFIRYTVARDIAALMEYKGVSLKEACHYMVHDKLVKKGGEGGLIAIDKDGHIEMPFNSEGMYRGWAKDGKRETKIFKEN